MNHNYPIKYYVEKGSFSRESLKKEEDAGYPVGACDALLLVSVMKEDEGFSTIFLPFDGTTGEMMTDLDVFKIWTLLAGRLSESAQLSGWKKEMVDEILPKCREKMGIPLKTH